MKLSNSLRRLFKRPGRSVGSLGKKEDGVAAVELAMVSPFLLVLMVGIIDFGSLFFLQNNMHSAARVSARSLATQSVTAAQAKTMAETALAGWGNTFNVVATEPIAPATNVVVTITVPMADVAPIGLIFDMGASFLGDLQTRVTMRQEG